MSGTVSSRSRAGLGSRGAHSVGGTGAGLRSGAARARAMPIDTVSRVLAVHAPEASSAAEDGQHREPPPATLFLAAPRKAGDDATAPANSATTVAIPETTESAAEAAAQPTPDPRVSAYQQTLANRVRRKSIHLTA